MRKGSSRKRCEGGISPLAALGTLYESTWLQERDLGPA